MNDPRALRCVTYTPYSNGLPRLRFLAGTLKLTLLGNFAMWKPMRLTLAKGTKGPLHKLCWSGLQQPNELAAKVALVTDSQAQSQAARATWTTILA